VAGSNFSRKCVGSKPLSSLPNSLGSEDNDDPQTASYVSDASPDTFSWLGDPGLAAGRNVQHPERHFQDPTVLILQAAVGYRLTSFDEARMHPYGPAMPGMEGIADLPHIPNMGVVLLSCIMWSGIIKV
jgi:hypothetical protein